MIFPSLYEELDMQRYTDLAAAVLPGRNVRIFLCDDSGQIIWPNEGKDNQAALIFGCNKETSSDFVINNYKCLERTHNGVNIAYFELGELAGHSAGELIFYDTGDQPGDTATLIKLHSIVEIVKAELGYLYEVNAMASELGERYDELAMLRISDLELEEYRESRHILSTYIRNCAEHLSADYAAIWISARRSIFPGGINYTPESKEILLLLDQLSTSAFEMFQNGDVGFGINDKDENLRRSLNLPIDKKVLLVPVLDATGKTCGVLSCMNEFYKKDFNNSDKSTLEAVAQKTYKYLVNTQDELTGLLNKKGFEESVWREVSLSNTERYLVLFNIEQFSIINAAYGMEAGDMVLQSVAQIISKLALGCKFATRLDADMFAVLMETARNKIESQVSNICDEIAALKITVDGKDVFVKVSAGVIALNSKETALADHLYAAELALICAKEESIQVVIYQPGNTALLKKQRQLTQVESIKHAIQEDRFKLYCQRIAPLIGDEVHYEILVRMLDESGGIIPPDDFIPVAERYNLMPEVDRWIIKNTFELLCRKEYRDISSGYKWGINLSGMTIGDPGFHEFVSDCLHEYDFQPTNLYFEITETAAIKNFHNCSSFMNKIHALGVQFALDDFGSGLSSFSYLKRLSIDYLKIDGSLIKDIVSSRLDQVMVSSIADIAKVLNVKTIAEYVENEAILEKLIDMNIDYAQGYGIMKPQPVELELESLSEISKQMRYSSN